MVFIDNIPSSASIDSNPTVDKVTSNISNSTISNVIRKEEDNEIKSKIDSVYNWLNEKSSLRTLILKWKAGTWNKWLDQSEVRKSRLTDLARQAMLNSGKDPDVVKNIKDDVLIKSLVWSSKWTNTAKLNAVNNYIQNWWYAENVFNYLVWNTSSVYETMWTPKEEKSAIRNFFWAAISTPVESAAWLSDITQKKVKYWWKTIYDINKESDIAWLWNIIWNVSEDRYQQYKKWELASKWYQPYNEAEIPQNIWAIGSRIWLDQYSNEIDFYKSYDEAKKWWFDWNVEQYGNYVYNMANETYNSTAEKVRNYLETEVYDPEWKWAWLWKFAWEMIEFALMPASKVKYLKYGADASKRLKRWVKAVNLWKWTFKLWVEWVKLQALEDAYNAEVSSIWKYATTAAWNAALWWILKWVWNVLWWMSWASKNAVWWKTSKELEEIINIVKNSVEDYNAEITPRTKIRDIIQKAREAVLWDRLTKWQELWKIRNFELNYKNWAWYSTIDALEKDINETLMEQANKMRFGDIAWDTSKIPQFRFTTQWVWISNPEVLNSISRNEKWQIVNLMDEINKVYNEVYWAWATVNAATTEKFLRRLDDVFWAEWWSWWPENFINLMKEWIKKATKKFDASLTEESLTKLEKARLEDMEAIKLDNAFKKIMWNLEWIEWVWASEKALSQTATTQELFKAVKKATKGKLDLNNEIWVWVAVLSAYDAKAARKLVENLYPSMPWAMEFVIKSVLWWVKKRKLRQAASDYSAGWLWKIRENIWWVVSSQI